MLNKYEIRGYQAKAHGRGHIHGPIFMYTDLNNVQVLTEWLRIMHILKIL